MRPGFLLSEGNSKKQRRRYKVDVMKHFAFGTWGPLLSNLTFAPFRGMHRYIHTRTDTAFHCWEAAVHKPDAHFHNVYTEKEEDIVYLPEWISEVMIKEKESDTSQWCVRCVVNHNKKAQEPRTTAEYWAFWVLYRRFDENSPLSRIPYEVAHHIAQFLMGPYIPTLKFEQCRADLVLRQLGLGVLNFVGVEMEDDEEEIDSSDLQEEEEEEEDHILLLD